MPEQGGRLAVAGNFFSDSAEYNVCDTSGRRASGQHEQPDSDQLGTLLCLSDGDSPGAARCLVHEQISHFDTDTITADAANRQPLISEYSGEAGIGA
jgi:hypothetical protein